MAPRGLLGYLSVAALVLILIGLCVPVSRSSELPPVQGSPGTGPQWMVVDPPRDGGGGGGEGGDPDEVVVYRTAPRGSFVPRPLDTQADRSVGLTNIRDSLRIRTFLFWVGLAR